MLHCGTTDSVTICSCGQSRRPATEQAADFSCPVVHRTQKRESEQPFEALSWRLDVYGDRRGSACALEGLFKALPRFLSRRLVSGCSRERAHFVSASQ